MTSCNNLELITVRLIYTNEKHIFIKFLKKEQYRIKFTKGRVYNTNVNLNVKTVRSEIT